MAVEITSLLFTLYEFYDAVFQPLLAQGPYVSLGFFSFCLAGVFSIIYWYFLDVEATEEIKEKMSHHQEKMKEARKNENTDKASDHMQKSMEMNQKLMKENLRPMVGTIIFVALIFPWLGATYAPVVELSQVNGNTWEGDLSYAGQQETLTVENATGEFAIVRNGERIKDNENFRALGVDWEAKNMKNRTGGFLSPQRGQSFKAAASFVKLPVSLPFIGDELNWLGFYIMIAMPLTWIFRKMLGVA